MNCRLRMLPLLALGFLAHAPVHASMQQVLIGDPALYGPMQNGFPFGTLPGYYGHPSTRYQQVYGSGAFITPVTIRELVFFPSSNLGAAILPGTLQFFLSVTDRGVDQISFRPFDDNLGADTQHFATLNGGFTLSGSEFVIHGTPFLYDPAQGNLLLDIRVDGAPYGHTGPFFAALGPSAFSVDRPAPFSRWHDFGIGFDDQGLVTAFRGSVAEPGTLLLLGFGLAGLVGVGLARRSSRAVPR